MKRTIFYIYGLFLFGFLALPFSAHAQTTAISLNNLTTPNVAIYGWNKGVPTILYVHNENHLFPIASITKLVTAKVVEKLFSPTKLFTISKNAMTKTIGNSNGITPGMVISRDDLLRALLISSNNGAGAQFAETAGTAKFITAMNSFLHTNKYTTKSFSNPTGLDPASKKTKPNSMTPWHLSQLLSDIYTTDPLLTSIMEQKSAFITDTKTGAQLEMRSSDELNYDPLYNSYIILGKTGKTNLAGEDLAFITSGGTKFDYITVIIMGSKNRMADGKMVLDWLQLVFRN